MSAVICPWCQSEIIQEEGQEPDKICPVCENELDGYRTLQFELGEEDDEEEEDPGAEETAEVATISIDDEEDLSWMDEDGELESGEELEQFEETLEELLNEQDVVPECPTCREYMVEVGERTVEASEFRSRVPDTLGEPLLSAPFRLTMYVCPSCFSTQSLLGDEHRQQMVRRLSQDLSNRIGKENGR